MLGRGGRRGCPVGQFGQLVEQGGPVHGLGGNSAFVTLPAVHGGERNLGRHGRTESRLPAEYVVDGEDLPDRGPPTGRSPPAAGHPLRPPAGCVQKCRVVTVLGRTVGEHVRCRRGAPRRGGPRRFQVAGGRGGLVHRVTDERGDSREEPCVGHLGQNPGHGFQAHLTRRGPGVVLHGTGRFQLPDDRGGDLLEQLFRPGVRQVPQRGGALLVAGAHGVPVGHGRDVRGARGDAAPHGARDDGPQASDGALGAGRVRLDRSSGEGHDGA